MNMIIKEFKPLVKLLPRECKLFKSISHSFDNRCKVSDVLIFDYLWHVREVYIKYSDEDYFVEVVSSGTSSCGKMKTYSVEDVQAPSYLSDIKIYINDSNLMMTEGLENNFFSLVGEMKLSNRTATLEVSSEENKNYFERILTLNYLELPKNVVTISYAYKSEGIKPLYFLIYHPTYYFSYDNFKVVIIEDFEEDVFKLPNVIDMQRFKDGGTTNIKCEGDSNFHFPTPFKKNLDATFNGMKIVEVNTEERVKFKEILKQNGFEVKEK